MHQAIWLTSGLPDVDGALSWASPSKPPLPVIRSSARSPSRRSTSAGGWSWCSGNLEGSSCSCSVWPSSSKMSASSGDDGRASSSSSSSSSVQHQRLHPDAKVWVCLAYLKFWTLHRVLLIVYLKYHFIQSLASKELASGVARDSNHTTPRMSVSCRFMSSVQNWGRQRRDLSCRRVALLFSSRHALTLKLSYIWYAR